MADKPVSLDDFVAANPKVSGYRSWCDSLPEDVRTQILAATDASASQVVAWLRSIGYVDATYARVDHWRRKHGRRSTGDV